MSIRQILAEPETVSDLELAAGERLREAQELVARGMGAASVYLAGYAAEMTLKYAVFRFDGAGLGAPVAPRLRPARDRAALLIGPIDAEHYHSILFWALLLREVRRSQNRALGADVAKELGNRARRMHDNWSVAMRYRKLYVRPEDSKAMIEDVGWLRKRATEFWR